MQMYTQLKCISTKSTNTSILLTIFIPPVSPLAPVQGTIILHHLGTDGNCILYIRVHTHLHIPLPFVWVTIRLPYTCVCGNTGGNGVWKKLDVHNNNKTVYHSAIKGFLPSTQQQIPYVHKSPKTHSQTLGVPYREDRCIFAHIKICLPSIIHLSLSTFSLSRHCTLQAIKNWRQGRPGKRTN